MLILNNSPQQVSVTICDKEYVFYPYEEKRINADCNNGVALFVKTTAKSKKRNFYSDKYDISVVSQYLISQYKENARLVISWSEDEVTTVVSFGCCFITSEDSNIRLLKRFAENAEEIKKTYRRRWLMFYLFWQPVFLDFHLFAITLGASLIIGLIFNMVFGLLTFALLYVVFNVGLGLLNGDFFQPKKLRNVFSSSMPKYFDMSLEEDFIMQYYSML